MLPCQANICDLVLDCFLGTGTTAIVCERLKRRWVGIEKHPEYVEIARKRLAATRQTEPK